MGNFPCVIIQDSIRHCVVEKEENLSPKDIYFIEDPKKCEQTVKKVASFGPFSSDCNQNGGGVNLNNENPFDLANKYKLF